MSQSSPLRRVSLAITLVAVCGALGACSSASVYQSDYVSPIAATPAPQPDVPMSTGAPGAARRMPLLPPVPGESSNGLPPVTMASLLPPQYN